MHVCTYICVVKLEEALQTNKFPSQKQKASLNVLYTAWWLKSIISKELKAVGITHEQYNVMRILKGKHPEKMCVKDIGNRMIEKNSNVPRIIDRLVAKKYVTRTNSTIDKRETVNTLTASGINLLENATILMEAKLKKVISLSEEEAKQLNNILENYRANE